MSDQWGEPTAPGGPRMPSAPRERRPALAALAAALLVVVGALAAGLLVMKAGKTIAVIEVDQQLGPGQQIPASALREVQIAAMPPRPVPARCSCACATASPAPWSTPGWPGACGTGSRTAWSRRWRPARDGADAVRVNKESLNQVLVCEAHQVERRARSPGWAPSSWPGEHGGRPVPPVGDHGRGGRAVGRRPRRLRGEGDRDGVVAFVGADAAAGGELAQPRWPSTPREIVDAGRCRARRGCRGPRSASRCRCAAAVSCCRCGGPRARAAPPTSGPRCAWSSSSRAPRRIEHRGDLHFYALLEDAAQRLAARSGSPPITAPRASSMPSPSTRTRSSSALRRTLEGVIRLCASGVGRRAGAHAQRPVRVVCGSAGVSAGPGARRGAAEAPVAASRYIRRAGDRREMNVPRPGDIVDAPWLGRRLEATPESELSRRALATSSDDLSSATAGPRRRAARRRAAPVDAFKSAPPGVTPSGACRSTTPSWPRPARVGVPWGVGRQPVRAAASPPGRRPPWPTSWPRPCEDGRGRGAVALAWWAAWYATLRRGRPRRGARRGGHVGHAAADRLDWRRLARAGHRGPRRLVAVSRVPGRGAARVAPMSAPGGTAAGPARRGGGAGAGRLAGRARLSRALASALVVTRPSPRLASSGSGPRADRSGCSPSTARCCAAPPTRWWPPWRRGWTPGSSWSGPGRGQSRRGAP